MVKYIYLTYIWPWFHFDLTLTLTSNLKLSMCFEINSVIFFQRRLIFPVWTPGLVDKEKGIIGPSPYSEGYMLYKNKGEQKVGGTDGFRIKNPHFFYHWTMLHPKNKEAPISEKCPLPLLKRELGLITYLYFSDKGLNHMEQILCGRRRLTDIGTGSIFVELKDEKYIINVNGQAVTEAQGQAQGSRLKVQAQGRGSRSRLKV